MPSEADLLFARGLNLHQQGKLADAQRLYAQVLLRAPRHSAALHHLGIAALQSGRPAAAAELISAAAFIDGAVPDMQANLARSYAELGRFSEALACYERAIAIDPRFSRAFLDRGNVLLSLRRTADAAASFEHAQRLEPNDAGAPNGLGNALLDLGRPGEALACFDAAIRLDARFPAAHFNRGNALRILGDLQAAVQSYDRALALHPRFAQALINRGLALRELGRHEESLASLDAALLAAPGSASVHVSRAMVLLDLKRPADALADADRALDLQTDSVEALNCRGIALLQLHREAQAAETLERAVSLQPEHADAWHNRGIALMALRRFEAALASFEAALALRPGHVPTIADAGRVLASAGCHPEARGFFARVCELDPDFDDALGDLFHADLHSADWAQHEFLVRAICEGVRAGRRAASPFSFLSVSDSADLQRRCAESLCTRVFPPPPPRWAGERYDHARIRIAYLSSDLREHAISYLLAGVFERHDRSRFEVAAVSLSAPDTSAMGRRVLRAFDRFIDVSQTSDAEAAALIHELEIDVLVDLNGYTRGMRPGILAHRPAAVQVNYLGFPGTMGAPFIDYLIADDFVIPASSRQHYREGIAYLPECFQANDDSRSRAGACSNEALPRNVENRASERRAAGLPAHGVVLCSFNNTFKLNPIFFDIWMRALCAVPSSCLWLLGDHPTVQARLRAAAAERGVDPARLLFAARLPYAEHLSRCSLADLILDSMPFNAGTTASDALWAGVPMLTCAGEAFAARMAGSLLRCLGLAELITYDIGEYERRLRELLDDGAALCALRVRVERRRDTSPVFDTLRFTRHLESAFEHMHRRSVAGEAPATFHVPALPTASEISRNTPAQSSGRS